MIEITSAEFIKGIIGTDPILGDIRPQTVFIGRSNVGKSSVINSLVNRKDLVRSGSMPGHTRQIDFFLVNGKYHFVDVPGYGYAKLPGTRREKLRKMLLWFLFESESVVPRKIVLIIDAEVGPKERDIELLNGLREYGKEVIVVANKIDKVKSKEVVKKTRVITEKLNIQDVILYSARTKKGRDKLLERIIES